ncbi:MAG TPA: hypothetical protein VHB79_25075 [Polyangiaceae bacterium]|nr:hypothetical protein [Polyangiaceae bacterium]
MEALVVEMAPGGREGHRDDTVFDRFLPFDYRFVSRSFWSPLEVVARAARWLDQLHIGTVVDIGSGVGKFCIGGALASRSSFIGIEQRRPLVNLSRSIARTLELGPRVRFIEGVFGEVTVPAAECYYFFNPFGESLFRPEDRLDEETEVSQARSLRDVYLAEQLIAAAPVGTYVMTYNGFGGTFSDEYELLRSDKDLPCALSLWRKSSVTRGGSTLRRQSPR